MTYAQLYRHASRTVRRLDPQTRDEIAHDAAVAALLSSPRNPLAWCARVARSAAWKHAERRRRAGSRPRFALAFSALRLPDAAVVMEGGRVA